MARGQSDLDRDAIPAQRAPAGTPAGVPAPALAPVPAPVALPPRRRRRPSRAAARLSPQLASALRYAGVVFLALRLGLLVLGLVGPGLLPLHQYIDAPHRPTPRLAGWSVVLTSWEREDALWYLQIAGDGYRPDDQSGAFFPLYPLLVHLLGALLHDRYLLVSALLISNTAFYAALVVVFRLTELELGRDVARRTLVYLAVFPFSLFFLAPYTESLFLLLSALTLYGVRQRRWWLAGLAGGLAAATRSVGIILVAVILVGAVQTLRSSPGPGRWATAAKATTAAALVSSGLLAYLVYWHFAFHDTLRPLRVQDQWGRRFHSPPETMWLGVKAALTGPGRYVDGYFELDLLLVLVVLAAAGWVLVQAPAVYKVFVLGALVVPLSLIPVERPFMSLPRFALPLFPLCWAAARLTARFRAHDAVVAASAAGLGICSLLFVSNYDIY